MNPPTCQTLLLYHVFTLFTWDFDAMTVSMIWLWFRYHTAQLKKTSLICCIWSQIKTRFRIFWYDLQIFHHLLVIILYLIFLPPPRLSPSQPQWAHNIHPKMGSVAMKLTTYFFSNRADVWYPAPWTPPFMSQVSHWITISCWGVCSATHSFSWHVTSHSHTQIGDCTLGHLEHCPFKGRITNTLRISRYAATILCYGTGAVTWIMLEANETPGDFT